MYVCSVVITHFHRRHLQDKHVTQVSDLKGKMCIKGIKKRKKGSEE
jgi:hypothetical protein